MFKYTVFSSALILFSALPVFAQSIPTSQDILTNTIVGAVNNTAANNCIPLSLNPRVEGYSVGNINIAGIPGSLSVTGTQDRPNCQPAKAKMVSEVNVSTHERKHKNKKK